MLIIDYRNKFTVDVEKSSFMDRDDFMSIIESFKKILELKEDIIFVFDLQQFDKSNKK